MNQVNTTSPNLKVTLIGDWDKVNRLISSLPLLVPEGAAKGSVAAAEKIIKVVKRNIRNNGPSGSIWPEYSQKYAERKASMGGNTDKKWRFNNTYYESLTVVRSGRNVYAGVPPRKRSTVNSKNGKTLTLAQVAKILENGSSVRNIKARPLWRPSFKEFGGRRRIAYHINWHIRQHIYIATGLRIKFQ
jgi:hypothetical protein